MTEPRWYREKGGNGHLSTIPFDAVEYIKTYRPRAEPQWDSIATFVRSVCMPGASHSYPRTHRLLRVVTRLSTFCIEHEIPLEPETALHPDTVSFFVEVGLKGSRSARTYRSELRYLGLLNTRKAPWRPEQRLPGSRRLGPYEAHEIPTLRRLAQSQPTELKRQSASALLLLGLGAGLDGRWVARVRPEHILRDPRGISVWVPDPERVIPVVHPYAAELEDFARTVQTECLVGKASESANRVTTLLSQQLVPPGQVSIEPPRLRATWLLDHLLAGTQLPALLDMAGAKTLRLLDPLMPDLRRRVEGTAA